MKLLPILIAVMVILSIPLSLQNTSAQKTNNNVNESLIFYLKNDTSSHLINNITTTYTFNTTMGNRGSVDSAKHYIIEDWYLTPVLAGNFTILNATFWIFIRFNGTDNNPNIYVNMSERAPNGHETPIGSGSAHPILATSIESYSIYVPVGNFTVPAGYSIHVHFQLNGGTSTIYWVYYGNRTYASGISINTPSHLRIESVTTLNYNYTATTGFNPQWNNKTMYIEALIYDPLGGYDINNVSCYFNNESHVMLKIQGTPDSAYSLFIFKTNFSNLLPGNYSLFVYALDKSGYYYYQNYYSYYYYLKYYETYFWVGLPIEEHIRLLSSSGIPLANALVEFVSGGAVYYNYTNVSGITNVYLFSGTYSVIIYWNKTLLPESMEIYLNNSILPINTNVISLNRSLSLTIYSDAGNASIRVLDADNMPVFNALVYITFPNGNRLLFSSNISGYANLGLIPGGIYSASIYYENVLVGNESLHFNFNRSGPNEIMNINTRIYHDVFQVVDSLGNGVPQARIYMLSQYGVEEFNTTDSNGYGMFVVPYGEYSLTVTWLGVNVYSSMINVNGNSFAQLKSNIYYLNISAVDGENKTLGNAYYSINGNGITMLLGNSSVVRLPGGYYNITTYWQGYTVNRTGLNLTQNIDLKVDASVYYLTVKVYDNNKNPLNGTEIFVEHNNTVMAYSNSPYSTFRLPAGNYTVVVRFNTEYYLTPISLRYEKNVTLENNANISAVLNYPPPIFTTYLFFIIIAFILVIAAFSVALVRKR